MTLIQKISKLIKELNAVNKNNIPILSEESKSIDLQIFKLEKIFPSDSGLDETTIISKKSSTPDRIVIKGGYRISNILGKYIKWSSFELIVIPTFDGIDISIDEKFNEYPLAKQYILDRYLKILNLEIT